MTECVCVFPLINILLPPAVSKAVIAWCTKRLWRNFDKQWLPLPWYIRL